MYKDFTPAEMIALSAALTRGFNRADEVYWHQASRPSASGHAMWNELRNLVQGIQIYVL